MTVGQHRFWPFAASTLGDGRPIATCPPLGATIQALMGTVASNSISSRSGFIPEAGTAPTLPRTAVHVLPMRPNTGPTEVADANNTRIPSQSEKAQPAKGEHKHSNASGNVHFRTQGYACHPSVLARGGCEARLSVTQLAIMVQKIVVNV